jgi:cytochrome c553
LRAAVSKDGNRRGALSMLRDTRATSSRSFLSMTLRLFHALSAWPLFVVGVLLAPVAAPAQTIEEKAQICSACHGENGVPQDKATPVIAGQHQGYLYLQLRDYKSGARANDLMASIAGALERDEMLAIAEYFSKQPWPRLGQPPASAETTAAARRANAAIGCTGCHLGEYQGDGTQPRLAGQSRDYLARTMEDFRTRARANNPGMTDLMRAASEADIAAMADYLAGL